MRHGMLLALVLVLPLLLGALTVTPTPARAAAAEAAPSGLELFTASKCSLCHSIASQKVEATVKSETMRGPDLSDVGNRHDAPWMTRWLHHEEELHGKKHKGQFKGSDEQLQQLVAWLASLKTS